MKPMPPTASVPRSAGLWRIDGRIGVGSTAYVYAATNIVDGRQAALKILRADHVDDEARERFRREGHVANAVGHPGVVQIFDQGLTDLGLIYIVMELLDGQSLETYRLARGGSLPVEHVADIGCMLLDVLVAAHARRVIHRDLKPANVFLTSSGQIKILDFGLARFWDGQSSSSISRTGIIVGTPAFMPPEQARGKRSLVDERSDIWALGATLFTLLAGRTVHDAPSSALLALASMTKPAPPLRSVAPHVPPAIADVIDRALAFEQADRWESADAMARALDAARRAPATAARVGVASAAPAPPPRWWSAAIGVASAFVAAGIVFGALVWSERFRRPTPLAAASASVVATSAESAPAPAADVDADVPPDADVDPNADADDTHDE